MMQGKIDQMMQGNSKMMQENKKDYGIAQRHKCLE